MLFHEEEAMWVEDPSVVEEMEIAWIIAMRDPFRTEISSSEKREKHSYQCRRSLRRASVSKMSRVSRDVSLRRQGTLLQRNRYASA
ncbi:hypothetical protein VNO78_31775 [Psophocarpus tetragonolobus]|uniref:Uncharacterized protein n=1 Tax=Psophocarpus tetragonolobus TaxID=3891 RepID=A0AAN9RZ37_PSOTE